LQLTNTRKELKEMIVNKEIEDLAYARFPDDNIHNNRDWQAIGYMKALKENKHKYTEEQMNAAINKAREQEPDSFLHTVDKYSNEEILNSINEETSLAKYICVEVEEVDHLWDTKILIKKILLKINYK